MLRLLGWAVAGGVAVALACGLGLLLLEWWARLVVTY